MLVAGPLVIMLVDDSKFNLTHTKPLMINSKLSVGGVKSVDLIVESRQINGSNRTHKNKIIHFN